MGFSIRFGGWRPVRLEEGTGTLHGPDGPMLEGVGYRFEVWHQMVDGFPGPYRSEGRISLPDRMETRALEPFLRGGVELELADGRRLPLHVLPDGTLLAHTKPPENAQSG